jgi:hypothetical protein
MLQLNTLQQYEFLSLYFILVANASDLRCQMNLFPMHAVYLEYSEIQPLQHSAPSDKGILIFGLQSQHKTEQYSTRLDSLREVANQLH